MGETFKITIMTVLLLGSLSGIGQQNIATTGAYFENSEFSVSYGVGELAIETFSSDNFILTQGFQQSRLTVTAIDDENSSTESFTVYPNPTSDYVNVDFKNADNGQYAYQIIDIAGKIIDQQNIANQNMRVSFVEQKAGVYFLQILSKDKPIKTYKIVKQ